MLSYKGTDCLSLMYIPRKPHKWGVILYQLVVRLQLSGKAFSIDFEPSLAHGSMSETTQTSPLLAAFRLLDRAAKKSWCSRHIAMDSAFSKEETFTWLLTKASYVTCALSKKNFKYTSLLTMGLKDNEWMLFYSAIKNRIISVLKDKGIKKEATNVITMSNAYVPDNMEILEPSQPPATLEQYLSISKLPDCALQLLCAKQGVEFTPGHPHITACQLTGFDYISFIEKLEAEIKDKKLKKAYLEKQTVATLEAICFARKLKTTGTKSILVHRLLKSATRNVPTIEHVTAFLHDKDKGKPNRDMTKFNPFAYYVTKFNGVDCFDRTLYQLNWSRSSTWHLMYVKALLWCAFVNTMALTCEIKSTPSKVYNVNVSRFTEDLCCEVLMGIK